jgi:hypothetical protein
MIPLPVLDARKEIRSKIAKLVVPQDALDRDRAAGTLAEFRGEAARGDLHGPDRLDCKAAFESAGERVAHVESIQRVQNLILGGAVHMQAAAIVLNHSRDDAHRVAQAVGGGIRDCQNVIAADALFPIGAVRIDAGHSRRHVDTLEQLAHVVQHERYRRGCFSHLDILLFEPEVSPVIDTNQVSSASRNVDLEIALWSRDGVQSPFLVPRGERDASAGHRHIVLVRDHSMKLDLRGGALAQAHAQYG